MKSFQICFQWRLATMRHWVVSLFEYPTRFGNQTLTSYSSTRRWISTESTRDPTSLASLAMILNIADFKAKQKRRRFGCSPALALALSLSSLSLSLSLTVFKVFLPVGSGLNSRLSLIWYNHQQLPRDSALYLDDSLGRVQATNFFQSGSNFHHSECHMEDIPIEEG